MPDVDLSHAIGLPPREAIQYFESKGLKFSAVAVLDCGMTENEKYIAYTRALRELAIIEC